MHANDFRFVTIPICPHIRKFILKYYNVTEPVTVKMGTLLATRFNYVFRMKQKRYNRKIERITEEMTFRLCYDLYRLNNDVNKGILINNEMDQMFRACLCHWVQAYQFLRIPERKGVKDFAKFYELSEDDFGLESLYKIWMRFKNRPHRTVGT